LEYERLQTLPDNYTLYGNYDGAVKKVADTNRYNTIGNGWTVDVIVHILKNIPNDNCNIDKLLESEE
jgi:DNA (cytosine-5)-methyltransferase 1